MNHDNQKLLNNIEIIFDDHYHLNLFYNIFENKILLQFLFLYIKLIRFHELLIKLKNVKDLQWKRKLKIYCEIFLLKYQIFQNYYYYFLHLKILHFLIHLFFFNFIFSIFYFVFYIFFYITFKTTKAMPNIFKTFETTIAFAPFPIKATTSLIISFIYCFFYRFKFLIHII